MAPGAINPSVVWYRYDAGWGWGGAVGWAASWKGRLRLQDLPFCPRAPSGGHLWASVLSAPVTGSEEEGP